MIYPKRYFLGELFPKNTDTSLAADGHYTNKATCDAFTANGTDRGVRYVGVGVPYGHYYFHSRFGYLPLESQW